MLTFRHFVKKLYIQSFTNLSYFNQSFQSDNHQFVPENLAYFLPWGLNGGQLIKPTLSPYDKIFSKLNTCMSISN